MKDLKTRIFSGIIALCMVTTMFPISASASNGTISFEEIDLENLEEMSEQITTNDEIQQIDKSKNDEYQYTNNSVDEEIEPLQESKQTEDISNTISETEVTYPVEGGNLIFDTATGTIIDCDISVTAAIIPSKINEVSVTSIGEGAFEYSNLVSIIIPDSVTSIENSAFSYCYSLTSVEIPDSVTSIGDSAFFYCKRLTSVIIPDSVISIEASAFWYCQSLTSVIIGNSVTSIGNLAFGGCSNLTGITIPDSVISIGGGAFAQCSNLTNVTIGNSVTFIGDEAFSDCSGLTTITIPDSVITIGFRAFDGCDSLISVTIGDGVTSIGGWAFDECFALKYVIIGNGLTDIGDSIFHDCNNLTSVTIEGTYIADSMFAELDSLTNVTIGDSVTYIGSSAFSGCIGLTNVTIPDSVTSIGSRAFSDCKNLDSLTIGNSVTSIGMYAFDSCTNLTSIMIPDSVDSIGDSAFLGCTNLTDVTIGNSVTTIGSSAFSNCISLTSMTIPDSVDSIGDSAFLGCTNLTDVTIGNSVTTIGSSAFSNCISLTSITIPDSVTAIKIWAFRNCSNLTSVFIGEGVISIGDDLFDGCTALSCVTIRATTIPYAMFEGFENLTSVTIGDTVTTIGNNAFSNCTSLANLTIGDSVTSIGNNAFYGCTSLTGLVLSDSVTSVGYSAFQNCTSLNSITLPGSLTSFGSDVFEGCTRLSDVTIVGTYIIDSMFDECDNLTSVTIEDSVTSIGREAFHGCSNLDKVTIGSGVTSIEYGAFYSCSNLTNIVIGDNVTSIAGSAFSFCDNLTNVYYRGSEEDWSAISISYGNENLTGATIHYNSTDPDDPDDPGTGSEISYVAGILKNYDPQEQKIYFEYYDGVTSVYEYKITDQTVVEDWDIIIGKPVLVSYIPGEYGTDTLSRYVITVQLAEPIIGNVDTITESTITLDGKVFDINLDSLIGLEYYIGETVACYVINDIIVDMKKLNKETGILNAGSNTSVTIDGVQYAAIFNGIPPYLPAPELWFEHEVEYYFYNDGVNQIIYKISLKSYSSTFTAKLTKWEGNTVTFEDDTIRQVAEDVAFDSTLIGKWVDYTVKTTADGGNVISSIILAKPTYKTEVKKLVAWNDGNPQFSDGTTMGVFIIGDQYDPIMIGRWVKLNIEDDLNTGTRIKGISLVEPSSKGDFKLLQSTDIYLKNNQYSFDGQNYEDSSEFEIEFEISIQNIVEGVTDTILSEMKTDVNMELIVEDIQITEPNGFNFGWGFPGPGEVGDVKGLEIPAGEVREVTGFIRPGMWYFVDEKEVTETITCKIVLSNGDVFEKQLLFTIHNLDYEEPSTGGDGGNSDIKDLSKDAAEELEKLEIDKIVALTNINLLKNELGLSEASIDELQKSILTNLVMCTLPEESLSDIASEKLFDKFFSQYKLQVSVSNQKIRLQYLFDTPKYGKLTIAIDCNLSRVNLDETEFAMYGFLDYTVLNQEKNSPAKFPSGSFGMIMQYDIKDFADAAYKLAEEEIKENLYDDTVGNTVSKLADIVFSETTKNIFKYLKISPEEKFWELITWPTKSTRAACPIDVYVYDSNGNLCGAIEDNVIIKQDPDNFELRVEGDVKYILGLEDDYRIEYVATDNGTMDVEITEEIGYNRPFRKVSFDNVVLKNDGVYSQNTPSGILTDVTEYTIISSIDGINTSTIYADSEEFLLNLNPDNTENSGGDNTGGSEGSDDNFENSGDNSSNDTGSDNGAHSGGGGNVSSTYAITVKDTDNGTITCSASNAAQGNNILITVKSDEGYELSELSVIDKNENTISLVKKNKTQYTFTMPASKVTVNATFSKIIVDPEPSSMPFTDVSENAWYYNAVRYVYENGMMQGISDTEFAPTSSMNRAMIVTVLHRLENTPVTTNTNQFTDVESNQWYTEAVQWAFENDIVNGYSSDKFAPMDNVTREQLAVILYNYTNYKGGNTDIVDDLTAFKDADDISDWSKNAISWAVGSGLLSGKGNGILDPKGTATRAEVAQILMNFTK